MSAFGAARYKSVFYKKYADSAFIILLILLASQNSQFFQWSSDDGRFQNILGFMGPPSYNAYAYLHWRKVKCQACPREVESSVVFCFGRFRNGMIFRM